MASRKTSTTVVSREPALVIVPTPVTPTPEQRKAQEAFVASTLTVPTPPATTDEMAALKARQKEIAAQLKALRDAQAAMRAKRQENKLADVIREQTDKPNGSLVYTLGAAMRQRMRAGAAREDAIEGVAAMCRDILASAPSPEDYVPYVSPRKAAKMAN